jgi:hypothetical protein
MSYFRLNYNDLVVCFNCLYDYIELGLYKGNKGFEYSNNWLGCSIILEVVILHKPSYPIGDEYLALLLGWAVCLVVMKVEWDSFS